MIETSMGWIESTPASKWRRRRLIFAKLLVVLAIPVGIATNSYLAGSTLFGFGFGMLVLEQPESI
jgi:hypothetical protein